jgi:hypothetical protein
MNRTTRRAVGLSPEGVDDAPETALNGLSDEV